VDSLNQNNSEFSEPGEGLVLPPWEERSRYGFLNSLYLTIKDVMLSPSLFFGRMPSRIGLVQPLLFAIVVNIVSAFFLWMWSLTGSSLQMFIKEDIAEIVRGPFVYGLVFIFSPVIAVVDVFLTAGLVHVCLMLIGGNRLGFEATFRVMAYSSAVYIMTIIPFCGNLIALVWGIAIIVIGLQRIHDIDGWRALVAVFLPLVLCLAGCGGVVLLTAGYESLF
jgi:hypothetical protein